MVCQKAVVLGLVRPAGELGGRVGNFVSTVVAIVCLAACMPEIFYSYVDPNEEYQLVVNPLSFGAHAATTVVNSALLLLCVWSFDWVKGRLSFWIATTLFATMVVPAVVVGPLVYRETPWTIVEVNVLVAVCFVGFVALTGYVESLIARRRYSEVGGTSGGLSILEVHLPDRQLVDWALLAALLVGGFIVVFNLGFNVNIREGLDDVYVVRLLLRDADLGLVGYLSNWAIVLAPCILYGILGGRPWGVLAALVASLLFETAMLVSTSSKVGIWHAVLPLFFFLLRSFDHRTRVSLFLCGLFVVTVVLPFVGDMFPELELIFKGVPRRVFYATGFLHGLGIEIFAQMPPLGFQDVRSYFTGEIVPIRYTYLLGLLSGLSEGANANVGFLTDGYVNGRYLGMIAVTVVAALTAGLIAGLAAVSRSTIGTLFLIGLGQQYAETAVQQVYLTGGVLIVLAFLATRATLLRTTGPSTIESQWAR
jgi:hypothetical protein